MAVPPGGEAAGGLQVPGDDQLDEMQKGLEQLAAISHAISLRMDEAQDDVEAAEHEALVATMDADEAAADMQRAQPADSSGVLLWSLVGLVAATIVLILILWYQRHSDK